MRIHFLLILSLLFSSIGQAQFHKPSVNLFKQQTKAIQNALQTDCPTDINSDTKNAFTQNANHPCLNPPPTKTSP